MICDSSDVSGTLWAAIYVFDDSQEMRSCCACPITADGLLSESVNKELTSNEFTGRGEMTRGVIKVISSSAVTRPSPSRFPDCGHGSRTFRQRRAHSLLPVRGAPVNVVEKGPWFVTETALADSNLSQTESEPGDPVFLWVHHWQRLRLLPLHARRLRLLVFRA